MRHLWRITFGAAVAAALGFGATQAMAAPSGSDPARDRACPEDCDAYCISIGGTGGSCVGKVCRCFF
jgi:hypothetical protein